MLPRVSTWHRRTRSSIDIWRGLFHAGRLLLVMWQLLLHWRWWCLLLLARSWRCLLVCFRLVILVHHLLLGGSGHWWMLLTVIWLGASRLWWVLMWWVCGVGCTVILWRSLVHLIRALISAHRWWTLMIVIINRWPGIHSLGIMVLAIWWRVWRVLSFTLDHSLTTRCASISYFTLTSQGWWQIPEK